MKWPDQGPTGDGPMSCLSFETVSEQSMKIKDLYMSRVTGSPL